MPPCPSALAVAPRLSTLAPPARLRRSPPPRPRLTFNLTLAGEGAGARAAGHDRRGGLPRAGGRHQDDVGLGGRPLLIPASGACADGPLGNETPRSRLLRSASRSLNVTRRSLVFVDVVSCCFVSPSSSAGFPIYAGPRENGRHGVSSPEANMSCPAGGGSSGPRARRGCPFQSMYIYFCR